MGSEGVESREWDSDGRIPKYDSVCHHSSVCVDRGDLERASPFLWVDSVLIIVVFGNLITDFCFVLMATRGDELIRFKKSAKRFVKPWRIT